MEKTWAPLGMAAKSRTSTPADNVWTIFRLPIFSRRSRFALDGQQINASQRARSSSEALFSKISKPERMLFARSGRESVTNTDLRAKWSIVYFDRALIGMSWVMPFGSDLLMEIGSASASISSVAVSMGPL